MAHLEVIHGALKDAVAEHLRHHPLLPPWAVSADDALSTTAEILLDVEATLLGYWTDIPEAEIQRILPRLREALGKTV